MFRTLFLALLVAATGPVQAATFKLEVHAADADGRIERVHVYNASGCRGDNRSPTLRWENPPEGTSGYAVTVYDPDAEGGWWHWVVLDIPAITTRIDEDGTLPPGAFALKNSFGHPGWDGPCPPKGDAPHHYRFTVYALDTAALALTAETSPEEAMAAIRRHALGKAQVTYTYGR